VKNKKEFFDHKKNNSKVKFLEKIKTEQDGDT